MNYYLTITKNDDEQRLVYGIASTETIDSQPGIWEGHQYAGDVVDQAAIKAALPDYLQWANIREMHQASAVGTALSAEVVDGTLRLAVKVVDERAWTKVKTGVYKGFSIGGRIVQAVLEKLPDGTYIRRILKLILTEISLVDRPANPDAKILLFKGAGMDENDQEPTPSSTPGLTADEIAALQQLAGTSPLAKAGADPQKIISLIQAARNEAELGGDTEGAALYTEAIKLVLQAAGDAEPTEPEAPDSTAESEQEQLLMQSAKPSTLHKAGRAISGARMTAMQSVAKTLLQLLAEAGDAQAAKAMAAYGGAADSADEVAMGAKMAGAIATALGPQFETLAKGLLVLNDRLSIVERQPAPGGPILRSVEKTLVGQKPAPAVPEAPALTPFVKAQLDNLQRLANTDPNPHNRAMYQRQYEELSRTANTR